MTRLIRLSLLLAVMCLTGPALVWGQTEPTDEPLEPEGDQAAAEASESLEVEAQTLIYEEDPNTVTATGDVVVTKGQTRVTADTIRVNRNTNQVNARGNVVVHNPQGTIEAEALQFDMEDETGQITNGTVRLPSRQYTITGKRLQKSLGQTYHIDDGTLTTCQCDDPHKADWTVAARTLDLTRRGRGVVRGGSLRVRTMPALYLPYAVFPVQADRQSGLLFPGYGFSSERGFQFQQPLYWALNKSHDVTLTADIETKARLGLLGEYRYAPNRHTEGRLIASYFNEKIGGLASTSSPLHRWSLTGTHRQRLPYGVQTYGDFFFVSDDRFLRNMNTPFYGGLDDTDLRSRRWTRSRAGAVKTWRHAQLRAETFYFQDLRNDDKYAFQALPTLQFQTRRWLLNGRVETGLAIHGANFYRRRGYYGQRLHISPWLSLPFSLGGYAFGSLRAIGHETIYHLSSEESVSLADLGRDGESPTLSPAGDRTRETVQLRAELGTRLSRVFVLGWGRLHSLKHVLEPHVSYTYSPVVDQDDLPLFDGLDRINRRSLFIYRVTNRIVGKFISGSDAGEDVTRVRELLRLTISQAYDPTRRLRGAGREGFGLSETAQHFSDVILDAHLHPFSFFSIRTKTVYDIDQAEVTATRFTATLRDPRRLPPAAPLFRRLQRRSAFRVSYRAIADRLLKELDIKLEVRLNAYFSAAYSTRYDLNDTSFVRNSYYLRVLSPQQCWAFDFGIVNKVNPSEVEFRFMVTLVGLSSFSRQMFSEFI